MERGHEEGLNKKKEKNDSNRRRRTGQNVSITEYFIASQRWRAHLSNTDENGACVITHSARLPPAV